ncbi:MAG: hypothetical protein LBI02_05700 [Opitutaceae bacterium]|jgi:hypothetical protein|nr:hypothetical protein [Opitutaceae bacterium]
MKKQIALLLAAFALSGMAFAQAVPAPARATRPAESFLTPSAHYMPRGNGLKGSFGYSLSSGVVLHESHRLGLDIGLFDADYRHGPGKMKFMPLTSSYQYALPFSDQLQMHAGVFAGAMFEKNRNQPGISNSRRTAFTYGTTLGFDFAMSESFSAGVSGKWLHVDKVKDLRKRDLPLVGLNCCVKF